LLEAVVGAGWVADSVAASPPGRDRPQIVADVPAAADPEPIRPIMSRAAGVLRDHDGLAASIATLLPLARSASPAADPALVALLIGVAALRRCESRGGHFRSDFPAPDPAWQQRHTLTLETALHAAEQVADRSAMAQA
jgi:L-aspartate oxidase